eukprot:g2262.t1
MSAVQDSGLGLCGLFGALALTTYAASSLGGGIHAVRRMFFSPANAKLNSTTLNWAVFRVANWVASVLFLLSAIAIVTAPRSILSDPMRAPLRSKAALVTCFFTLAWMICFFGVSIVRDDFEAQEAELKRRQQQQQQPKGRAARRDDDDDAAAAAPAAAADRVNLGLGYLLLLPVGPYVALQIAMCTAWEWLDKHSINMLACASRFSDAVSPHVAHFVRHPKDGFMVPTTLWLGVCLPLYFLYELRHAMAHGFVWQRVMVYNLVRIGPMYANFMYVYVLCHKEGHSFAGLFAKPYHTFLNRFFNYWVGLFHGVLPGTFTESHTKNHHRYDNTARDDISCGDRPRDEWHSFVRYVPRWFAYATNVATLRRFALVRDEKGELKLDAAARVALGTAYYVAFLGFFFRLAPLFTAATLLYPLIEANLLLAIVNFTWHAFNDPDDPENEFVISTTIIDGLNFTLREEYHVVHHMYAGVHWSKHQELFEKHKAEYKAARGTLFYGLNLFELFGMCVAKDYDQLAEKYHGQCVGIEMGKSEVATMLKRRLQYTQAWARDPALRAVGPMFLDSLPPQGKAAKKVA